MGKFQQSRAGPGAGSASGKGHGNKPKGNRSYQKNSSAPGGSTPTKGKSVSPTKSAQKKWSKPRVDSRTNSPHKGGNDSTYKKKPVNHKANGNAADGTSSGTGKSLVKTLIDNHNKKPDTSGSKGDKKHGSGDKKKATSGGSNKKGAPSSNKKGAPSSAAKSNVAKANAKLELVGNLKNDWNKVRIRSINSADRNKLIDKLLSSIRGHVLQVTLRHDVSRIVQCILQFGNDAQRSIVVSEMAPKLFEICKTPYGHFAVLKAITYCTVAQDQKKITSALAGHFVALGTNVIGARTVESILKIFPSKLTRSLRAEFYGKNFIVLMAEAPKSLRSLIESITASRESRESSILDHMSDLIQKFINKGLLEFEYVHHLLWEYIQEVQNHEKQNRMSTMVNLLAEQGPRLMTSKAGAKAMCSVVGAATAKDRKRVLKSLKGHVLESCLHPSGHLYIMRILDVVDDTVSLQKLVLSEIRTLKSDLQYTATGELIPNSDLPALVKVAISAVGSKVLLRLLAPQKRHLEPDEEPLFATMPSSSKKSPSQRRKELLLFMRASLVSMCVRYASVLVRSRCGSKVFQEVASTLYPNNLLKATVNVMLDQATADEGGDEGDDDDEVVEEDQDDEAEGVDEDEAENDEAMVDNVEDQDDEEGDDVDMMEEDGSESDEEQSEHDDTADVVPVTELLPIEEDVCAHQTLRRILDIQTALSSNDSSAEPINTEFHETGDVTAVNVANSLFNEIVDRGLLSKWANSSRGCFSLAHMLEDSETKAQHLSVAGKHAKNDKAKAIRAAIASGSAEDSAGAKKLLELLGKK
jgi:pumilio family protein 6